MAEGERKSVLDEAPGEDPAVRASGHGTLESLLDSLNEAGAETISVDDVVHKFEHRSVGALIAVLGLIAALPVIGGVPGMSIATATLILLVIGQSFLSKSGGLWVPRLLGERRIDAGKVAKAVEKARPCAAKLDRWLGPRFGVLTGGRPQRLAIVVAIVLLTLTFYPLAFVPWGVTPASLGVLAFGLALMTGDGYLALFGYAMAAATIAAALLFL